MTRNLAVLIAGLSLVSAPFSPAEFMLCIHQDGQVVPEEFREDCCESECDPTPSDCPDDQCHDVPVAVTSQAIQETVPAACPDEVSSPVVLVDPVIFVVAPAEEPARGSLDPPGSPPLVFLRTVVLRL